MVSDDLSPSSSSDKGHFSRMLYGPVRFFGHFQGVLNYQCTLLAWYSSFYERCCSLCQLYGLFCEWQGSFLEQYGSFLVGNDTVLFRGVVAHFRVYNYTEVSTPYLFLTTMPVTIKYMFLSNRMIKTTTRRMLLLIVCIQVALLEQNQNPCSSIFPFSTQNVFLIF